MVSVILEIDRFGDAKAGHLLRGVFWGVERFLRKGQQAPPLAFCLRSDFEFVSTTTDAVRLV